MSGRVRINITTIPGRIFFWFLSYRPELFLALSLIFFFICKSSISLNSKISDTVIHYIAEPSSNVMRLPITTGYFIGDFISSNINLRKENITLKKEVLALKQISLHYEKFAKETEQLQKLLNFKENHNYMTTTARIFINNTGSYHQTSLINVGTNELISKNQIAISENGLVGRVIEANKYTSHILLYSDPKSRIPVYSSNSRERAIIVGNSNELPKIKYLARHNNLEIGEIIYTSGDGIIFPADIPVGISTKDQDGEFVIKPFVTTEKLEFVSIVNIQNEAK